MGNNKKQGLEMIIGATRRVITLCLGSISLYKNSLEECNDDGTLYISSEEERLRIQDKILMYEQKLADKQKKLERYIKELELLE